MCYVLFTCVTHISTYVHIDLRCSAPEFLFRVTMVTIANCQI